MDLVNKLQIKLAFDSTNKSRDDQHWPRDSSFYPFVNIQSSLDYSL